MAHWIQSLYTQCWSAAARRYQTECLIFRCSSHVHMILVESVDMALIIRRDAWYSVDHHVDTDLCRFICRHGTDLYRFIWRHGTDHLKKHVDPFPQTVDLMWRHGHHRHSRFWKQFFQSVSTWVQGRSTQICNTGQEIWAWLTACSLGHTHTDIH